MSIPKKLTSSPPPKSADATRDASSEALSKAVARQQDSIDELARAVQRLDKDNHDRLAQIQDDVAALRGVQLSEMLQLKTSLLDSERSLHEANVATFTAQKDLHGAHQKMLEYQTEIAQLHSQIAERDRLLLEADETKKLELAKLLHELHGCKAKLDDLQQVRTEAPLQTRDSMQNNWQRSIGKRPRSDDSKKVSFQFATPPDTTMVELDAMQRSLPFRNSSRTSSPIEQPPPLL